MLWIRTLQVVRPLHLFDRIKQNALEHKVCLHNVVAPRLRQPRVDLPQIPVRLPQADELVVARGHVGIVTQSLCGFDAELLERTRVASTDLVGGRGPFGLRPPAGALALAIAGHWHHIVNLRRAS